MLKYDGGLAFKWGASLILISLMINSESPIWGMVSFFVSFVLIIWAVIWRTRMR